MKVPSFLGNTTTQGSYSASKDYIRLLKFTTSKAGTLDCMLVHAEYLAAEAPVKCAIYDSSLDLLTNGTTEARTVVAAQDGWMKFNFSTPPSVASSTVYWLAIWIGSNTVNLRRSAGGTDQYANLGIEYTGTFPNSITPDVYDDFIISICACYTMAEVEDTPNLWSKLEDADDVLCPEIGTGGVEGGSPSYAAAKFNNGSLSEANGSYVKFPTAANNISADFGTVEFWLKMGFAPDDADSHYFFDFVDGGSGIRLSFSEAEDDFILKVYCATVNVVTLTTVGETWEVGDLLHFGIAWSRMAVGIGDDKTVVVKINNVEKLSSTTVWNAAASINDYIYLGVANNGTYHSDAVIDNLKSFEGCKIDFSDKDTEDTIPAPPLAPTLLECEGATNPTDVTDLTPELTAIFNDPNSGDIANEAKVEVASQNVARIFSNSVVQGSLTWPAGRLPQQRNSFYAADRYWVFYSDLAGEKIKYKTSTNGIDWSSATDVAYMDEFDANWSIHFDGTYIHYVRNTIEGGSGAGTQKGLGYRRGTPQSNGEISWSDEEQVIQSTDFYARDPEVTVDSGGYPWVGCCYSATYIPRVYKSSTNDGTWSEAAGFPNDFGGIDSEWTFPLFIPLLSEKMYVVIYPFNLDTKVGGQYWNGSTWTDEGLITLGVVESESGEYNVARIGVGGYNGIVHLVYQTITGQIRYRKRDADGNWETEVVLAEPAYTSSVGTSPVITVDGSGNLYVLWQDFDTNKVFMIRCIGGEWEGIEEILTGSFEESLSHLQSYENVGNDQIVFTYLELDGDFVHIALRESILETFVWQSAWFAIADVTEGNRCAVIPYDGSGLSLDGNKYYWRIKFKDDGENPGAFSALAEFTMAGAGAKTLVQATLISAVPLIAIPTLGQILRLMGS